LLCLERFFVGIVRFQAVAIIMGGQLAAVVLVRNPFYLDTESGFIWTPNRAHSLLALWW
jgi:hypothetical protein